MYERILLPTDGSVEMAKAVEQCLSQAELTGATVHALYVVDLRAYIMLPEETQRRVVEVLEGEGQTAMDRLAEQAAERGVELAPNVVRGIPHEEILTYADENEMDLVVMGTHGRTGEEKRVLGSVAEEVVRSALVPVLVVRMTEAEVEAVQVDDDDDEREGQHRYIA